MTETEPSAKLVEIREKYGAKNRAATHKAFDRSRISKESDISSLTRISRTPSVSTGSQDIYAVMAKIHLDLAELADEYGKLNVKFGSVFGAGKQYTIGEALRIKWNDLVGRKEAAKAIRITVATRQGKNIETLVDNMSEVVSAQYQKCIEGRKHTETLLKDVVQHMYNMEKKRVNDMRKAYVDGVSQAEKEQAVRGYQTELDELNSVQKEFESKIQEAKATNNTEEVVKATDELMDLLEIKQEVINGHMAAYQAVSDVRRKLVDAAVGVESATGALGASQVNYETVNGLVDVMFRMEVKYKHMLEAIIPVFKHQGRAAAIALDATSSMDLLQRTADLTQRLMKANADLAVHLGNVTLQWVQTSVYNVDEAMALRDELRSSFEEQRRIEKEWAEANLALKEGLHSSPHYDIDK